MADQRYTIQEQLGAGGNGAVYRAFDTQLKRRVAIKRLLTATEASSSDPNMEELRREADLLASLRNANIVTIFDTATDEEGLFMVMELLEGPDLADTIAHGPMLMEDFKQLAEQTLEALLAAHNLRILHRDIKPENIKVERLPGGRLQAKIIDFGLARTGLAARKQTEDQEGSVMGSIHYMAPEQLSREPTDVRTDLYALGCVFYEALSGRKAFDGKTVNEVIDKHIDHDVVPLHQLCPHLPQWLTYWVMRLMACKPDDRPANAQQAIEEFRAWEKLPPAPHMMPWMPMGYGYGYGAPQVPAYTGQVPVYGAPQTGGVPVYGAPQTGGVPVHTTGYYAVPQPSSSSVPIAVPETASAPVAVPVVETVSAAVPVAQAPRGPQRPGASAQRAPAKKAAAATSKSSKKMLLLGAGAVVVIGLGFFFLKGRGGGAGPVTTAPSGVTFGGAPEELFPPERSFPQPDAMRVVHFVPKVATHGYLPDGKPSPSQDAGSIVSIAEDLAKRGSNTPLVSVGYDPDTSPERIGWNTPDKAIKDGRSALRFKNKSGKPVIMGLLGADREKETFPFGSKTAPAKAGMTLATVFQADDKQLPARLLKLSSEDGKTSVSLILTGGNSLEVHFMTPGGLTKVGSQGIDTRKPTAAILLWNGETGDVELRTRDQRGQTNTAKGNVAAPKVPLYGLEAGSADADKAQQFSGILAELLIMSTVQEDSQAVLLDKDLREYYFNAAKPGALNPGKNQKLADFPVGTERDLFNGRDLAGWEGNNKYWTVQDSALTVKGDPASTSTGNCNLTWKDGTVGDFELNLKFRITGGGGNSGVFYRAFITGRTGDGPSVNGYQLDLDSGQRARLGGLYEGGVRSSLGNAGQRVKIKDHADPKKANLEAKDELPEGKAMAGGLKFGDWNDLRIVAQGNKLQHYLNNKLVYEGTDEGHARVQDGIIGFEWSVKNGSTGQFKDIRVKRLK